MVRPIELDSAPTMAPAATEAIVLVGRPPVGAAGAVGGAVRSIRLANISRALSRSTACPY
jgi:hypothetical protein